MPNESLSKATKSLNLVIRDLRETLDETQEMYHQLFLRVLETHNTLQTILSKLKDAELDDYNEST